MQNREVPVGNLPIFFSSLRLAEAGRTCPEVRGGETGRGTRATVCGTQKTGARARGAGDAGAGPRAQSAGQRGRGCGCGCGTRNTEHGTRNTEHGRRGRGTQNAEHVKRGRGHGHGARETGDGAQETGHKPPCMERNATAYAPPGPATTGLDRSQPGAIRRRDQSAGTFHGWTPAAGTRNNPPGPFTAGRHPPPGPIRRDLSRLDARRRDPQQPAGAIHSRAPSAAGTNPPGPFTAGRPPPGPATTRRGHSQPGAIRHRDLQQPAGAVHSRAPSAAGRRYLSRVRIRITPLPPRTPYMLLPRCTSTDLTS